MTGGVFTTALHLLRAAWNLIGRFFDLFSSLGGGLVSELVALGLIWLIVSFGLPILEKFIKAALWLIRLWR